MPLMAATTAPARIKRAVTDLMVVDEIAPDLYEVLTLAGNGYRVDVELGACPCPDAQYRDAVCKHQIRTRIDAETRALDREGIES